MKKPVIILRGNVGGDPEEHKKYFDLGENVDGHWKHRVWRNLTIEQVGPVKMAASYHYGCNKNQERLLNNHDGTWDYEAVYGCEDTGKYWLEQWDGNCVIGPNRIRLWNELVEMGLIAYTAGGETHVGRALRRSPLTVSLTCESDPKIRYWRISWYNLEDSIIVDW